MSRWAQQFENHPFHITWNNLLADLKSTKVDDQTIVTSVQELARLKKVITFVDKMIASIDPELVPMATWDNVNSQATPCAQNIAAFNSNRNIGHIQNANAHADNLITYVRPYMVAEGKAAKLLQEAAKEYTEVVSGYIESFKSRSSELLSEIQYLKTEAGDSHSAIQTSYESVKKFNAKLFGHEGDEGLESKIFGHAKQIEDRFDEINSFHDQTLVGDEKNPSTKKILADAEKAILATQSEIQDTLVGTDQEVKELSIFHTKIFGKPNEDGIREGGLQKDFEDRIKRLGIFEGKQVEKYNTLNAQIESLLPGATNAGLATAYRQMKRTFERPIRNAEQVFYGAIGALVIVSLVALTDSISWTSVTWAKFDTWDAALKALANKLPLYGALIWLAAFASTRRSEFQRLQQEYAHKESLAKSYNSYKKQLELLDGKDQEMQKEFITKAIDAIAYNASQTLDRKHGDAHPAQSLIGKVLDSVSEIKSIVSPKKE